MSKTKRYYWIKLRESFLTSDAVDFLMSQKNGSQYVVLYQMLCLKTANTDGKLARQIGDVLLKYDAEKIQRDTKHFDIDTIRVALELYQKLGLVYVGDDNVLQISNFEQMIGTETNWAKYKKEQRLNNEKDKLENVQPMSNKRLEIRDKDIKSKDIRLKEKELKNKDKDLKNSAEPIKNRSTPKVENEEVFIDIILNDKTYYSIAKNEVEEYQKLYQNVNVRNEIRKMVGWSKANPTRRKTKRGIKAFMNNWLSRQQDKSTTNVDYSKQNEEEPKIKKEKVVEKTEKEKKEMSDKRKKYAEMLKDEEF